MNSVAFEGLSEKEVAFVKKVLANFPEIDEALERTSLKTGFMAYFAWVVGVVIGMIFSAIFSFLLHDPWNWISVASMWMLILIFIEVKTVKATQSWTTLALARLHPGQRIKFEKLMEREGKRIGLVWFVTFATGFTLLLIGVQTGLPLVAMGIQLAVGLGNLLMARSGHMKSREPWIVGSILLGTLPVTILLEWFLSYPGFIFFGMMVVLSYLWASMSIKSKLARLEVGA
jgi:hypothetical protein